MIFTSDQRVDDDLTERGFTLDEVPGLLWTPRSATTPGPLVLLGHPGGLHQMQPRLLARARSCVRAGFTAATLELPGSADRPRLPDLDEARAELRRSVRGGDPVQDDVVSRLVLPLVDRAVPEWRAVIDALLQLPEVSGPVGYAGGFIAIGTRLVLVEPRVAAATLFAGSFVPRATLEEARWITTPLLVLLQWDDEDDDRQQALDLFDALGSREKTLPANTGGHTGVPGFEAEASNQFFIRHLI